MPDKQKILEGCEMEIVKHEACQQYVARRLSEGWKIIKRKGFNSILQSPEGIIRPVDLRNDTLTLRPNANGDVIELAPNDSVTNYENVNEAVPDEMETRNYVTGVNDLRDLYGLPNHTSEVGTINFVKVYIRCIKSSVGVGKAWEIIKTHGTEHEGTEHAVTTVWLNYSHQWDTNPNTLFAWTWEEIDALQAGVRLYNDSAGRYTHCTQVYVEVDYTPVVGWTGKISGVTNPAKVMGVDVASINSVKGVA